MYLQSLLDLLTHNLCPENNNTDWAGISGLEAIWAKRTSFVSECAFHISVLEGCYFEHKNTNEQILFCACLTQLVGAWQSKQTSFIYKTGSDSHFLFFNLGERPH